MFMVVLTQFLLPSMNYFCLIYIRSLINIFSTSVGDFKKKVFRIHGIIIIIIIRLTLINQCFFRKERIGSWLYWSMVGKSLFEHNPSDKFYILSNVYRLLHGHARGQQVWQL